MNGVEIVRPCDRHSNETVTLWKHITKYKTMRKLIVEFLKNFENRDIKIAPALDSYHQIYQFTVFSLILYGVEGPL